MLFSSLFCYLHAFRLLASSSKATYFQWPLAVLGLAYCVPPAAMVGCSLSLVVLTFNALGSMRLPDLTSARPIGASSDETAQKRWLAGSQDAKVTRESRRAEVDWFSCSRPRNAAVKPRVHSAALFAPICCAHKNTSISPRGHICYRQGAGSSSIPIMRQAHWLGRHSGVALNLQTSLERGNRCTAHPPCLGSPGTRAATLVSSGHSKAMSQRRTNS